MTAAQLEAIYRYGNYVEAAVWFLFALRYALQAQRKALPPLLRRWNWIVVGLFILFGFSDGVEVQTGGWWKPWWLLLWKGFCVFGLAIWAGVNWRYGRDR